MKKYIGIWLDTQKAFIISLENGRQTTFSIEYVKDLDELYIFGTSGAKIELEKSLKANNIFANIPITVEPANSMTQNQRHE